MPEIGPPKVPVRERCPHCHNRVKHKLNVLGDGTTIHCSECGYNHTPYDYPHMEDYVFSIRLAHPESPSVPGGQTVHYRELRFTEEPDRVEEYFWDMVQTAEGYQPG